MAFLVLLALWGSVSAEVDGAAIAAQVMGVDNKAATEDKASIAFDKADADMSLTLDKKEFTNWWINRAKQPNDDDSILDFHKDKDPSGNDIPGEFRDSVKKTEEVTLNFWTAFVNSIAMILVTEIGDKTFFIAAILAMRHNQGVVFSGAITALIIMTILSAAIGFALPNVLPRKYTHIAATFLFVYFGIKLLLDARELHNEGKGGVSEELEEVEQSLKDKNEDDIEDVGETLSSKKSNRMIFLQVLSLTFFAEWGDRSQIATIALAAAKDPFGVTAGGIIGHSCCTGLAVIGGRLLAAKISEKTVLLAGGILFLIFAVHALVAGPEV